MSAMPKPGDPAPPVQLQTDTGEMFDLANLRGRNVVLFFYPKADTPG
jgi:peroxiredoxin Q/BCP